MIFYMNNDIENHFNTNLLDWHAGGPLLNGWTRTGVRLTSVKGKLDRYSLGSILIDDVLAKNRSEVERWHLAFLKDHKDIASTDYYKEYLLPRFRDRSHERAHAFLALFEDIKTIGMKRPVWVADIEVFNLGFRYFRFEGCHRACCAKVLGQTSIQSIIFRAMIDS